MFNKVDQLAETEIPKAVVNCWASHARGSRLTGIYVAMIQAGTAESGFSRFF
jgi:hypothetical protein